jgi:hypothetical protein
VEEVPAMRGTVSPTTGRRYPLTMIAQVWQVARSSVYAAGAGTPSPSPPGKRGPKTERSDEAVVTAIRAVSRPRLVLRAEGRENRDRSESHGATITSEAIP